MTHMNVHLPQEVHLFDGQGVNLGVAKDKVSQVGVALEGLKLVREKGPARGPKSALVIKHFSDLLCSSSNSSVGSIPSSPPIFLLVLQEMVVREVASELQSLPLWLSHFGVDLQELLLGVGDHCTGVVHH